MSIRLPFESGANSVIAGDAKHVSMKYFFTRKLMLIKESQAFVCLPGGFGTLDETFELLTLTQTGKGMPVPIVLLDAPGDPYWESIDTFVRDTLIARGLVAAHDTALYTITDSCDTAAAVIERFYSNYHSIRFVGDNLVIRMRQGPNDAQLADLNERFGHLVAKGTIEVVEPFKAERRDDDHVDLDRIAFNFSKRGYSELISMIDVDQRLSLSQRQRLNRAQRFGRLLQRSARLHQPAVRVRTRDLALGGRFAQLVERHVVDLGAIASIRSIRSLIVPHRSLPDREDHVDRRGLAGDDGVGVGLRRFEDALGHQRASRWRDAAA